MKKGYSPQHIPLTSLLVFLLLLFLSLSLAGCQSQSFTSLAPIGQTGNPVPALEPDPVPESITQKDTITLTALGDILMHNTLTWAGGQPDGSYAFDFFGEVRDLMEEGDYCTTNLETALAGPETGYTGYPLFNSPDPIVDHLKEYGVDGVVATNNHLLDRGYLGALRTVKVIEEAGLDTLGIKKSAEESGFLIKDIRGTQVGYLSYTYGTNGLSLPAEHSYFINMLEKERILQDIDALRPQVELLILVLHWGVEYSTEPTAEQRSLAREFLEAGADAIVGSHPHVIQPVEYFTINGKKKFVAYSIGNFIGDQRGQERNSGVILQLKFGVEKVLQPSTAESVASPEAMKTNASLISHTVELDEVKLISTFSHSYTKEGRQHFRVIPVEETVEKIKANKEEILTSVDLPLLENVLKTTRDRLSQLTASET
ncbi:Bacterial capsule synthesis protein PGA_cap [Desulfitobacterium dichloroeliminans LMG P-21439]|uniref:Bacterial capsule synthesis protein PGA_cap n=1 Tax=Desulfitobacterium dichloroeliminans (strain LMG P-21439 / DCA1) TaxID=871963 RepID=L0F4N5_DESDL|nr:CapA family protein [Desulfitobacterium dichloroeliminans]AGA68137.1 Bacterial capsule synthesis protein PGA_cap [Desulfitobacterium dichloroeliminans LMG P-21439]